MPSSDSTSIRLVSGINPIISSANIANRAVTSSDVLSAVIEVEGVTIIVTGIGNKAMEDLLSEEDRRWATPEPFDAQSMVAALRVRAIVVARNNELPENSGEKFDPHTLATPLHNKKGRNGE